MWEEIIDGCLVKFEYWDCVGAYFFKIYLDGDEIFDSNDQGETDDREWARDWAATIIFHYLADLD